MFPLHLHVDQLALPRSVKQSAGDPAREGLATASRIDGEAEHADRPGPRDADHHGHMAHAGKVRAAAQSGEHRGGVGGDVTAGLAATPGRQPLLIGVIADHQLRIRWRNRGRGRTREHQGRPLSLPAARVELGLEPAVQRDRADLDPGAQTVLVREAHN
ncbi:MAG: hypothetical protein ABI355_11130 [Solirubrobacteraceae bacterium]